MIEVEINSDFGSYKQKLNHGHKVNFSIDCIDAYSSPHEKEFDNGKHWSNCPCCGLKPKIWTFNNGRSTVCGCGNSRYDHFSVHAESIMSVHIRCDGDLSEYNSDQLRLNWNEYCATMINPCSHGDLMMLDRW